MNHPMQILQLAAAFGQQVFPPLELAPGLNIIKVPSRESASAWSALIRDLLYGPDPGMVPRSAASQGRMECASPWGTVTVARWTASTEAPLGAFSALYTASGQPAAYLTPASCGDVLLGVPREIFDRYAVVHPPIPGSGQAAAAELPELWGVLERDQTEHAMLQARAVQLEDLLARHEAADRRQAALTAESAQLDFVSARDKAKTMEASRKPPPSKAELTALRSQMDILEAQEDQLLQLKQRADYAAKALQLAQTAMDAREPVQPSPEELPPKPIPSWLRLVGSLSMGIGVTALIGTVTKNLLWAAAGGAAAVLLTLTVAVALPFFRKWREWKAHQEELNAQYAEARSAYAAFAENVERARAAYQSASDAWEAEEDAYRAAFEQILTQVHSFRPFAKNLDDARQAVADGLLARRELDQVLAEEEEARLRWEALRQDAIYPLPPPVRRPEEDRVQLREELETVNARLEELQKNFSAALEERAGTFYTRLTEEPWPSQPATPEQEGRLDLAIRLAVCAMILPGSVPVVLEAPLDELDGGALAAALDCLTELAQTRQVLLLTDLDREASCLHRTHPDRFRLVKV